MHHADNSHRPIVWHKTRTDGPTRGSWSKLLSLGTTRVLRTLVVFREYVLRGMCTASTISISGLCTADTASTGSISSVGGVRTTSTRSSTELLSIRSVCMGTMRFTSTVCAPRRQFSQAHCLAQNTHRWSHKGELEQISFAGDNSSTQSTGSISGICAARNVYREYSQYLEVRYCGYCLYSQVFRVSILRVRICMYSTGSVLLILSVLSVFGPSQYSQYLGRQYSNTLSARTMNYTRAPLFHSQSTKNHFFGGNIHQAYF